MSPPSPKVRKARHSHGVAFRLIDTIGRATSLLIFALIAILLYGDVMRYAFSAPSTWVSELSGMIYACYFLIGGAYAVLHGDHVNVDVFRSRLSPRGMALLDIVTWTLFYIMIGVVFWLGCKYAYASVLRWERSSTTWAPYIWPVKLMLPVAAFLMLLAGARKTLNDIRTLIHGAPVRPAPGKDAADP